MASLRRLVASTLFVVFLIALNAMVGNTPQEALPYAHIEVGRADANGSATFTCTIAGIHHVSNVVIADEQTLSAVYPRSDDASAEFNYRRRGLVHVHLVVVTVHDVSRLHTDDWIGCQAITGAFVASSAYAAPVAAWMQEIRALREHIEL
ncbi:ORF133 hypothetical protein [Bovine papular stomatitis virus]|uniref:Uncharacterized protein n=1 Tax=Bovine papular stomatitis virus TaxID=129727 RepID=Q6TV57_9POXV|nr:ORF133 hypothetical protein [Bovine papular stomatitis virus]AAR98488.1 ORF133 hypothetical protein [Bovine papular stomatitis virus]